MPSYTVMLYYYYLNLSPGSVNLYNLIRSVPLIWLRSKATTLGVCEYYWMVLFLASCLILPEWIRSALESGSACFVSSLMLSVSPCCSWDTSTRLQPPALFIFLANCSLACSVSLGTHSLNLSQVASPKETEDLQSIPSIEWLEIMFLKLKSDHTVSLWSKLLLVPWCLQNLSQIPNLDSQSDLDLASSLVSSYFFPNSNTQSLTIILECFAHLYLVYFFPILFLLLRCFSAFFFFFVPLPVPFYPLGKLLFFILKQLTCISLSVKLGLN